MSQTQRRRGATPAALQTPGCRSKVTDDATTAGSGNPPERAWDNYAGDTARSAVPQRVTRTYLHISRAILHEVGVDAAIVWAYLSDLPSDRSGWAGSDLGELSTETLLPERSIRRSLRKLAAVELIEFCDAGRHRLELRPNRQRYSELARAWEGRADGR